MAHRSLCGPGGRRESVAAARSETEERGAMKTWMSWMLAGAILFASTAALALDPAIKCQAKKLKLVGKYTFCRMLVEAKAARARKAPDFSRCDEKFGAKWEEAEARASAKGIPCWTSEDAASIQEAAASFSDSAAAALAP
jgi:hypothetical protein